MPDRLPVTPPMFVEAMHEVSALMRLFADEVDRIAQGGDPLEASQLIGHFQKDLAEAYATVMGCGAGWLMRQAGVGFEDAEAVWKALSDPSPAAQAKLGVLIAFARDPDGAFTVENLAEATELEAGVVRSAAERLVRVGVLVHDGDTYWRVVVTEGSE